MVLLTPLAARAVDFGLKTREPGPGHRMRSYWWKFNQAFWELTPPEHYTLNGGGEMRLEKVDQPSTAAICRPSTAAECDLLRTKDQAAQDKYFRTLLPSGILHLKLVTQRENPLPVNGLTNVEAVYSYDLGGVNYLASYMVSRAVAASPADKVQPSSPADKAPAQPKPAPKPGTSAEDYFTAVVVAPQESQPDAYQAIQQLMATAKIADTEPDSSADQGGQYSSHGMLGR